jgi:hypothetical protein
LIGCGYRPETTAKLIAGSKFENVVLVERPGEFNKR